MAEKEPSTAPDSHIDREVGIKYWNSVDADDNAMLGGVPSVGGFSYISKVDLQGSRTFLARLGIGTKRGRHDIGSALEAGAGIGRVTEGLLLNVAKQVDVIEPVAKFTAVLKDKPGVQSVFTMGLEDWQPAESARYDLVWIQWCVGHLTDVQLVGYLERCKTVLTPETGFIVVKENLSTGEADLFDECDSSVTRQDNKFRALFEQAGLRIVRTELQRGLPERPPRKLLPLRMYALKP